MKKVIKYTLHVTVRLSQHLYRQCQNEESRKRGITNPIQASLLNVVLLSMQRLKKENRME